MKQLYKAPAGETGLFIAGGWHGVTVDKVHGPVLTLPADGDFSHLQGLGYTPVPMVLPSPTDNDVASDRPEVAATPLQPRTKSA